MDIPIEVLVYLFKYLPHSDRIAASQTCRLWFEAGCDKAFQNDECVFFVKNVFQDDAYPSNVYTSNSIKKFNNFAFREVDLSNKMTAFWEDNGFFVKCLEFDQCDMQEKVFVNILNLCPNLESLTVSLCRELFMSARLLEELDDGSLKKLTSLNLSTNRYLSDALFHKLVSTTDCLSNLDLSHCPVSFHPGLFKKFYPFGVSQDGTKTPSESVLTFHSIFNFLETGPHQITKLSLNKTLIDGPALKAISELPNINLTSLNVNECDQLNFEGIISLTQHQINLVELDIGMCSRVTDKSLIAICDNLVNLKNLCINRCRAITNIGVMELHKLQKLQSLDISQCELITDEGIIKGICRKVNPTLRQLNVSSLNLGESTITIMAMHLPNLTGLNMNFCFTSVTDRTIQAVFKHMLNLQSLELSQCEQVSDAGLTGMGMGKQVSNILPEVPMVNVAPAENVHKISLRSRAEEEIVRDARRKKDIRALCENFGGETLQGYSIARLKNLTNLDISGCNKITDVSLTFAFQCIQLKHLDMSHCQQITYEGLKDLAESCPSLETVKLVNCFNTRDEGVDVLVRKLHRLKHLHVRGCNLLTDASLHTIKSNGKVLKSLDIQGCRNITPELASSLSSIPTLHTLLISKPGPYITDGVKKRFPVPPPFPKFSFLRRRNF